MASVFNLHQKAERERVWIGNMEGNGVGVSQRRDLRPEGCPGARRIAQAKGGFIL